MKSVSFRRRLIEHSQSEPVGGDGLRMSERTVTGEVNEARHGGMRHGSSAPGQLEMAAEAARRAGDDRSGAGAGDDAAPAAARPANGNGNGRHADAQSDDIEALRAQLREAGLTPCVGPRDRRKKAGIEELVSAKLVAKRVARKAAKKREKKERRRPPPPPPPPPRNDYFPATSQFFRDLYGCESGDEGLAACFCSSDRNEREDAPTLGAGDEVRSFRVRPEASARPLARNGSGRPEGFARAHSATTVIAATYGSARRMDNRKLDQYRHKSTKDATKRAEKAQADYQSALGY